jgi:hypothetical protein
LYGLFVFKKAFKKLSINATYIIFNATTLPCCSGFKREIDHMKLTLEKLKQLIREQVEEMTMDETDDMSENSIRNRYMQDAEERDGGWSGRKDVAAEAGKEYDLKRSIGALKDLPSSELDRLEKRAVDSLHYSGERVTDDAVLHQMAHLANIRRTR